MIKVRFPNGQCIQYNDATGINVVTGGTEIIRKDKTTGTNYWVAFLPAGSGCLVEWVNPCAVSNPVAREMTPESALALVRKHLRTLRCDLVAALKQDLCAFNAKRRTWK